MDSSSGKCTGILCDAKQKNYKIKYLGRHEDGTESKSNLMSDCSVGKEQKQPVQHEAEQHQITQGSVMSPFLVLFQQSGWEPFQAHCPHKGLALTEAPVRKQEKS